MALSLSNSQAVGLVSTGKGQSLLWVEGLVVVMDVLTAELDVNRTEELHVSYPHYLVRTFPISSGN